MNKLLSLAPSVPTWIEGSEVVFDRKFYDGVMRYLAEWPGTVKCIMNTSNGPLPPFGVTRKTREALPFELVALSNGEKIQGKHIEGSKIVLASGDSFNQFHLSRLCQEYGAKCIYIIEYIPETRHQILDLHKISWVRKLRRKIFLITGERKRREAFKKASGLQANGAAAFFEYKEFPDPLLYFDTRVPSRLIIGNSELQDRLKTLSLCRPLHIAFSGRLERLKGADDLIPLASLLRKKCVNFRMSIYGAGQLENTMHDQIEELGLSSEVLIKGSVDFYKTLIPNIKETVDLFVLPHKQSDPSCTYLETLSCGVPIVGYNNKAFEGLLKKANIGWGVVLGDIAAMAEIIAKLDSDRSEIEQKSNNSREFSLLHDFEATFKRRVAHLRKHAGV